MATNYSTSRAFADHYRTGKFTDLGLVAKGGTQFNVHKLVVCSHSPVLDAQAANGATILDTADDATILGQMIEWMYGIDDEQLLIDGKSVGEVVALGLSEVYGEILTLSDLAGIAEKYQLPKLKYQATQLVGQLVEKTTSLQCLLEAVLHLAREDARGTMQKILASRALDLTQAQDDIDLMSRGETTLSHREKHRPTPLSSNEDAITNKERETSVNIDRSALRSATGSSKHARQEDTDSDTPLTQQRKKRKKKETESHDSPSSNASKTQPTRRNEPFRISTALPENDPAKGPHCHCKVASTDPTLLACADCGNKYHPRCVGKGRYGRGTYSSNPQHYMLKDLDLFKEKPFKCGDCEEGFFGGR